MFHGFSPLTVIRHNLILMTQPLLRSIPNMYYDTFLHPFSCCCHSVGLFPLYFAHILNAPTAKQTNKQTNPSKTNYWLITLCSNIWISDSVLTTFYLFPLCPCHPILPCRGSKRPIPLTWGLAIWLALAMEGKWTCHAMSTCMLWLCPLELLSSLYLESSTLHIVAAPSTQPQSKTLWSQERRWAEPRRATYDWEIRKVFCSKPAKCEGYKPLQQNLLYCNGHREAT